MPLHPPPLIAFGAALALGCQTPKSHPATPPSDPLSVPDPSTAASVAPEGAPETNPATATANLTMSSGVASGEVTSTSAILWSRCNEPARLHFSVQTTDGLVHQSVRVGSESDFAGQVSVSGLEPAQDYVFDAWCAAMGDAGTSVPTNALRGSFSTAPREDESVAIRFAWGGDLGGQNVCRDETEGYPIFTQLSKGGYDFFVALGDLIYADSACNAVGAWGNRQVPLETRESRVLADFHAHWRYNREDAKYRGFLSTTPYYSMWDDHEVVNDFGPKTDHRVQAPYTKGVHLMPAGLRAMLDYNPLPEEDGKLYRRFRWGKHVELFFVDARQYRDENTRPDVASAPKALLGERQIEWLLSSLLDSDATWRFIINSVPLSVPTGLHAEARDGFADLGGSTGFERELRSLLSRMAENDLTNTVWLTTDVHIAAGFHYVPLPEKPKFVLHEFISGPMSAGFFPRDEFDKTFNPTRHFTWAVHNVASVKTYEQAKELFNFGEVVVDEQGELSVSIVNTHGTRVATRKIPR